MNKETSLFSRIKKNIEKTALKVLIYGVNGVGKSTFASQTPNPIFINFDDNISHIEVDKFFPKSYEDFIAFLEDLEHEDHNYKTLVIDCIDSAEIFIKNFIASKHGKKTIEEIGYGVGHAELQNHFNNLIKMFSNIRAKRGMNIVVLSHVEEKSETTSDGKVFARLAPSINKKSSVFLLDWCQCILYACPNLRVEGKNATEIGRIMITECDNRHVAKNVFDLKPVMNFSWEEFSKRVELFFFNKEKEKDNK